MTATIDVEAVRAATPGVRHAHHLNAAGCSLASEATLRAVTEHLELEARAGGYEAAAAVRPRLEAVYEAAAALLGANPHEIALVESATVGWRRAIDALRLAPGHRVVVSRSAYVSFALQLLALERERGVVVDVVPSGDDGAVDLARLEQALGQAPALLALAHVPTSSGLVEPVAAAGALARAAGVPFMVDATQSAGQLEVDVGEIACDLLVTTGRKYLRAPRGTGLLYVRGDLTPAAPDVRGAEWVADRDWTLDPGARRFETWEASTALRLGLGVALDEAAALGTATTEAHLTAIAARLRAALAALPGVEIADPPAARSAIVTFHVPGMDAAAVAAALAQRRVNVVAVPAAHGLWDLGGRGLPAVVRASPHVYDNDADLEALLDGVGAIAGARKEFAA
ncbi:MAG TPA: aminotransferase class V-fold PLP-dependent enzyme [Solirubrobacteraceae bacterium]|nr:aminotransferase class V-fold PLP-dependent enzyme [Solirubrobacteraceae bacterium]